MCPAPQPVYLCPKVEDELGWHLWFRLVESFRRTFGMWACCIPRHTSGPTTGVAHARAKCWQALATCDRVAGSALRGSSSTVGESPMPKIGNKIKIYIFCRMPTGVIQLYGELIRGTPLSRGLLQYLFSEVSDEWLKLRWVAKHFKHPCFDWRLLTLKKGLFGSSAEFVANCPEVQVGIGKWLMACFF